MEGLIGILLFFGGLVLLNVIINAIGSGLKAGAKTVGGKGSFSENFDSEWNGMRPFETRLINKHLEDDESFKYKEIQARGLFPVDKQRNIKICISVLDITNSDSPMPIISMLEDFTEDNSTCYQCNTDLGVVEPNVGFPNWVKIGVVIPDLMQPPFSGKRRLSVITRLIDTDANYEINLGFAETKLGVIHQTRVDFDHQFSDVGYSEQQRNREESQSLSLQAAVAVSMADGSLDQSEGTVLQNWIKKEISIYTGETREELKELYNSALREAYKDAKNNDLSLSSITHRLNEIAEKKIKYDTIELCLDVMAADGHADPEEIKTIRNIASALSLDLDEIEKMKDQRVVTLDTSQGEEQSYEYLLGIDPSEDASEIKRKLRIEFQKWNDRINNLPAGEERDNAQNMLNMISELRKKYG